LVVPAASVAREESAAPVELVVREEPVVRRNYRPAGAIAVRA
jgi:hypothetical protein